MTTTEPDSISETNPGQSWLFGAILAVGLYAAITCLYIEYLNSLCGSLPNREWYNGDPARGPVKWRESAMNDESAWRMINLQADYADYETRVLTASQRREMHADIKRASANNDLREFVGRWGLLQYLAVPLLAILSFTGLRYSGCFRMVCWFALVLAGLTGWRLYALAYFPSLGW